MTAPAPTTSARIPALDGVRAIAITFVVLVHMLYMQLGGIAIDKESTPSLMLSGGWMGVELFFVLSGFLVGGHIVRQALDGSFRFGRFYMDRTLRIFPIAYVFLLLLGWQAH